MQLHTLKRPSSLKRPYRRVGRGQSSTRGKQSGRGGKGQTARAGNKRRPEWRDIIKKLPKRRGYGKNRGRTVNPMKPRPIALSLALLGAHFDTGAEISPKTLVEEGLAAPRQKVKLVGNATAKKYSVSGVMLTAGARAAIEQAGGKVV